MKNVIVKTQALKKYYQTGNQTVRALDGVNFEVAEREFVSIVGKSGSGKSTLLHMIGGLDTPSSGTVIVDGLNLETLNSEQLALFRRRKVGFIFQQYYLLPNMSVDKNVKMGADLANNKDYKNVIRAVGLGEKLHKYPSELSGGEQQRVSIARALAKRPRVLFLDEPTGALDEQTGRQVLDYICKLQKEYGFTIVMVTHNLNIAEMANTVIKMNSGKISEIYTNEAQKTAYEIGW
jgi:putative ABC transport system ATP-binding protein